LALSEKKSPMSVQVGDALPERELTPDNVQLFLYNAALWNAHRIHFDEPYTKGSILTSLIPKVWKAIPAS